MPKTFKYGLTTSVLREHPTFIILQVHWPDFNPGMQNISKLWCPFCLLLGRNGSRILSPFTFPFMLFVQPFPLQHPLIDLIDPTPEESVSIPAIRKRTDLFEKGGREREIGLSIDLWQSLEFPVSLRKIPVWRKRGTTTHYKAIGLHFQFSSQK